METNPPYQTLLAPDGVPLAYCYTPAPAVVVGRPTVVFLHGYRSDMTGDKAQFLSRTCAELGLAYLRMDYSGHGRSGGVFHEGTIGRWRDDALYVLNQLVPTGPLLLVGSSMGGWIGLLLSLRLADRLAGFIGIAAAPDFTEWIWADEFTQDQRAACLRDGFVELPSPFGDTVVITREFIEDGRNQALLGGPIPFVAPVTLLQGKQDADVPWAIAEQIAARLVPSVAKIVYVEDGDHRLSRPQDLTLLRAELEGMLHQIEG